MEFNLNTSDVLHCTRLNVRGKYTVDARPLTTLIIQNPNPELPVCGNTRR